MTLCENLHQIDKAAQKIANFVYQHGNEAATWINIKDANLALGENKTTPAFDIRETWMELLLSNGVSLTLHPLNQYNDGSFALPDFPSTIFINADDKVAIVDSGPNDMSILTNCTPQILAQIQSELTAAAEIINLPIAV